MIFDPYCWMNEGSVYELQNIYLQCYLKPAYFQTLLFFYVFCPSPIFDVLMLERGECGEQILKFHILNWLKSLLSFEEKSSRDQEGSFRCFEIFLLKTKMSPPDEKQAGWRSRRYLHTVYCSTIEHCFLAFNFMKQN